MSKGKVLQTTIDINGNIDKSVKAAFEQTSKRIEDLSKQSRESAEASKKLSDGYTVAKNVLANLVSSGIEKAISGLKNLAGSVVDTGMDFSSTMAEVQALSGASGDELQKLEDTAREYGATTVFSASEAAAALKYMALAGWDTEQSTSALGGVLDLAAASGMGLAEASDMVTDYLSAFGMAADKSSYFADLLAYAQAHSNTSAAQLGEAYKNTAASMNAAGQDIETTTSLLAMMANQGLKGSEAGTALTAVMRDMTSKMEDGAIEIGKTSVAVMDASGNYRDLTDILMDVQAATSGMGDAERAMALSNTFTSDSLKGLNLMLNAGVENAADFEEQLRKSGGAAGDMADTMNDNLSGDLKEMQSGFDELKLKIYDGLQAPLRTAVGFVTSNVIPKLDSIVPKVMPMIQSAIDGIAPITEGVIDLATNGIGFLSDNIDVLIPIVAGLTGAFVAYKAISAASNVVELAKAAALKASEAASLKAAASEAVKTAATATGTATVSAATVAQWAFNSAVAFLTSPVTIAVAAIGALIAIGVLLYRNWDTVKEKAAQLGTYLSGVWQSIKENVSAMISSIKAAFTSGFNALVNIVTAPFRKILGFVDRVKSSIGSITGKSSSALPAFAAGGFTKGLSIAGEAGTEAVISFDPAYRAQNLSYWAQAGRMLGADTSSDFSLSGSSGDSYVNMGGVTFAPQITVTGQGDKASIMEAIEEEYPEFIDMLEEWFAGRGKPVYA